MTKVSDIGERRLIERMMRHLTQMPGMPIPFWDDASAISLGDGRALVINTDMLVWETDIPRGMTPYQAARKAVVMSVSDLGAKGVQPIAFMPSIGLPSDYPVASVEEMARGFEAGAREYGAYVVGGDTNEACDVVISGVALGVAQESKIMKRASGACPGDLLATTGAFGLTSAGFKHLLEGLEIPGDIEKPILDSIYLPRARVNEGIALAETVTVTGCMDSSDGLAVSLYDLARSTGAGFRVTELPADPAATKFAERHDLDIADLVLYGGEEYELVFTFRPENEGKIRSALGGVGCSFVVIGEVTGETDIVLAVDGALKPIGRGGWDHFTG
ncbi:MAG TPA: thiamine-phosphate kinase [Candidatus Krumholzibacteriaceae bacterium]|nr:thiamine-phosphate kinase [Candidatus Krumholzibacteriaceae bacterium]